MPRDAEQYPQLTRDFDDAVIERPVLRARRAFRHALSILLVLWLGLSTAQAASTLRIEVARDATGQATLSDMLTADASWEPLEGLYSGGYTEAALWFRLQFEATHDNARHILWIQPTPLDQLTLYGVSATGLLTELDRTGDQIALADRTLQTTAMGFKLSQPAGKTYFIRLNTTSSALFRASVHTEAEFQRIEQQRITSFIAFTTIILAFFIWTLFELIRTRELVIGLFGLSQLLGIGYTTVIFGFATIIAPQSTWTDFGTSVAAGLIGLVNLALQGRLAHLFSPPRWVSWLFWGLVAAAIAVFALLGVGDVRGAMTLVALYSLLVSFLYLVWAATVDAAQPGGRLYRLILLLQWASLTPALVALIGLPLFDQVLFYLIPLQQIWATVLIGILLIRRAQYRLDQAQATETALKIMEAELGLEQSKRADQSRFMDMLVHELKTPIAVIQMSLDTLEKSRPVERSLRALQNMNQVIERSQASMAIEHGAITPTLETLQLNALVHDVLESLAQTKRIQYQPSQIERIVSDRVLLRTVLGNVIENALKYSPLDGQIKIIQHPQQQDARAGIVIEVINVSNDVTHLAEALVFEKYYRGPDARGQSGSGLGLYLCAEILRTLGGYITFSVHNNTVTVTLWIPRSIS
ncbi:MAG: hypothetical protein EBS77_08550 [Gammaproteobacteria bacterium]|nr:hypothetical protein [Gammaproteobacteria bacterium]